MAFVGLLSCDGVESGFMKSRKQNKRGTVVCSRTRRSCVMGLGGEGVGQGGEEDEAVAFQVYSPAGMTVEGFFDKSLGRWQSQRSSHNLAFSHFEEIRSELVIESVDAQDDAVQNICATYGEDPATIDISIRMSWEGESDWDENEELKGSTVLVVIKDSPTSGRLLRSEGYAETIPAIGQWTMQDDGCFVLLTPYDRASAEERIWFAGPDLRLRVSLIRTQLVR